MHNPNYHSDVEINSLSDREAMGLSKSYHSTRLKVPELQKAILQFCNLNQDIWIEIVESHEHDFYSRYACGYLLGLSNDPRISTFYPTMIFIKGKEVEIGLSPESLDEVMKNCEGLGLKKEWIEKECPNHHVILQDFALAKYLITNSEYAVYLEDTKSDKLPSSWEFGIFPIGYANHPVYTISSESAQNYCQWLSEKTKRKFRLPTEAEWEYAASGGEGREYPWGNKYHEDRANTAHEGIFDTTPVGMFSLGNSVFGHCDMAGNVEEYTSSQYGPYPKGDYIADDLSIARGNYNVARGGSFTRFHDLARCKRRHGQYLRSIYAMGFRLCEDLQNA